MFFSVEQRKAKETGTSGFPSTNVIWRTSICCRMAACLFAALLCWAFLRLGARAGLLGPGAFAGCGPDGGDAAGMC